MRKTATFKVMGFCVQKMFLGFEKKKEKKKDMKIIWGKIFRNGPIRICGIQPLKYLK